MRRLVVAPHADDESFGCGGLMAKYPDEMQVLVLAEPSEVRWVEFTDALNAFSITEKQQHLLNLPDGAVGANMSRLVELLDLAMAALHPAEVYLPFPGLHQDHIAAYEAGMRACRRSMTPSHWFPPNVFVYDVPAYDLELQTWPLRWNQFEVLSEADVRLKARAIGCYKSELTQDAPHPGTPEEAVMQAKVIGASCGVRYAEKYAPVRVIRL
jgi:LmbE family N-acetylglucosaminyl deacetylase